MAGLSSEAFVIVGEIRGLYGVSGWVKIFSFTEPRDNILTYSDWYIAKAGEPRRKQRLETGRRHGKGIVAKLEQVNDRDAAAAYLGADIAVKRSDLPVLPEGEYYWADLEGMEVYTVDGAFLGFVRHLFSTGSNDVMVVQGERERLIPFLRGQVIDNVDLQGKRITVDWDPDF